ncbi:hypothetical protein GDO78_002790 [Eleutherodactylus coqui]|uniref:NID domain-containing protein n=1 Tax=Eleutherodactylus coqui TaxID=57060 RepID=A0A8J6EZB9_ELECQ|nr:hypothetical protein GDO78_002790 [Eleutherodactylus coqui]
MDYTRELKEELDKWKERCEEEEKRKSEITLAKLDADDLHCEAQDQLRQLMEKSAEMEGCLSVKESDYQREMKELQREKDELMRNIDELGCKMKECGKLFEKIRSDSQFNNELPHKDINCTKEESASGNLSNISYTCQIVAHLPYVLQGGRALLTFEKEEVAQRIIDKGRQKVEFSNGYEEVTASPVQLGRTVTFEINMDISNTKVKVFNLPIDLPEETLKDKLELTFYKSNVGGGEIESVECNRNNHSACITYEENGVAQRALKTTRHLLTAGGSTYEVGLAPVIEIQLNKLLIFSGICRRSVQLSEIAHQTDSEDDIKDSVEIHFQKPSNGGDEVEHIAFYLHNKLAHFEEDTA